MYNTVQDHPVRLPVLSSPGKDSRQGAEVLRLRSKRNITGIILVTGMKMAFDVCMGCDVVSLYALKFKLLKACSTDC